VRAEYPNQLDYSGDVKSVVKIAIADPHFTYFACSGRRAGHLACRPPPRPSLALPRAGPAPAGPVTCPLEVGP